MSGKLLNNKTLCPELSSGVKDLEAAMRNRLSSCNYKVINIISQLAIIESNYNHLREDINHLDFLARNLLFEAKEVRASEEFIKWIEYVLNKAKHLSDEVDELEWFAPDVRTDAREYTDKR